MVEANFKFNTYHVVILLIITQKQKQMKQF